MPVIEGFLLPENDGACNCTCGLKHDHGVYRMHGSFPFWFVNDAHAAKWEEIRAAFINTPAATV